MEYLHYLRTMTVTINHLKFIVVNADRFIVNTEELFSFNMNPKQYLWIQSDNCKIAFD